MAEYNFFSYSAMSMQNVWFTVIYKQIYECQWNQTTEKEGTKFLDGGTPKWHDYFYEVCANKGVENDSIRPYIKLGQFLEKSRGCLNFEFFLQFYSGNSKNF